MWYIPALFLKSEPDDGQDRRRPEAGLPAGLRPMWTPRSEARFPGALTRTNNLEMACDQAGMTLSSYEAHHRRWRDFRRRVREARAFASARLEAALEAEAGRPLEVDFDATDRLPPPSIAEALAVVRRHRR
jgi:hypothetical protein